MSVPSSMSVSPKILSLDALALRFGLSRRHLTRRFRQWSGVSIQGYQERQRIRLAEEMLIETTLQVGEIAWRVGFESGSALARAMRRITGHSPSEMRAAARQALRTIIILHECGLRPGQSTKSSCLGAWA